MPNWIGSCFSFFKCLRRTVEGGCVFLVRKNLVWSSISPMDVNEKANNYHSFDDDFKKIRGQWWWWWCFKKNLEASDDDSKKNFNASSFELRLYTAASLRGLSKGSDFMANCAWTWLLFFELCVAKWLKFHKEDCYAGCVSSSIAVLYFWDKLAI